jgi:hypothetical protein
MVRTKSGSDRWELLGAAISYFDGAMSIVAPFPDTIALLEVAAMEAEDSRQWVVEHRITPDSLHPDVPHVYRPV